MTYKDFYSYLLKENSGSTEILYHGSSINDIDEFIGGWWTPNKSVAREFGPIIYKANVTINNPAYDQDLLEVYREITGEDYSEQDRDYELADIMVERYKDELIKRGYDGIITYDDTNIESDFAYVPFYSNQIELIK